VEIQSTGELIRDGHVVPLRLRGGVRSASLETGEIRTGSGYSAPSSPMVHGQLRVYSGLLAFDPRHMVSSMLQYLFLASLYVNLLNMYALLIGIEEASH
jgi:hypothetical protein